MFATKIKSFNFGGSRSTFGLVRKICTEFLLFTSILPAFVAAQNGKFTGTPSKFEQHYFRRLTDKPKITTIPFTAEEFMKFAPGKITAKGGGRPVPVNSPVISTNGQLMITITKRTKYKQVESSQTIRVPLDDYVAEINKYETFLNQLGETLRDGKFNKQDPNDTLVRSDLGVLFALRNRNQIKKPGDGIANKPVEAIYNPGKFSRYIPNDPIGILRPDQRIKTLPKSMVDNAFGEVYQRDPKSEESNSWKDKIAAGTSYANMVIQLKQIKAVKDREDKDNGTLDPNN